jgi:hypothetical protein
VVVEEGPGICPDEPLWQRGGLSEERPVPLDERELGVGPRPHPAGGHHIKGRGGGDPHAT